MSAHRPYSAADVAFRLGFSSLDGFYRARQRLHLVDGLPRPIHSKGRLFWDRAAFDAWLDPRTRAASAQPANDPSPLPQPAKDDTAGWRMRLHEAYGR